MEKINNYQKAAIENMLGVHKLDYWNLVEEVFPRRLVNFELDCLSYEDATTMIIYLKENYNPGFWDVVNGLCKMVIVGAVIYWVIILLI